MTSKFTKQDRRDLLRRNSLVRVGKFALESQRSITRLGASPVDVMSNFSDYAQWSQWLVSNDSPLDAGVPWMPFSAVRYLDSIVRPGTRVFEYGAGGSTLYFAGRGATGISIEHDEGWARTVSKTLIDRGLDTNWKLQMVAPEPVSDETNSEFVSNQLLDLSFEKYAKHIDSFSNDAFDIVVVDGRIRNACVRRAMRHVKPGGCIVLDNSERPHYEDSKDYLRRRSWREKIFTGPIPSNAHFSSTSVFLKPG